MPEQMQGEAASSGWVALLVFCGFLVWLYVYLVMLRPQLNAWLAQYIHSYPAALHLFPIIGGPILLGLIVSWLGKLIRSDRP
jgi:hypothetical protein